MAIMLELFETESSTILATYDSLDEALRDIREEVCLSGRMVARTWALSERHDDGSSICIAIGDALTDQALAQPLSAAS
jgi:hypothetical protein